MLNHKPEERDTLFKEIVLKKTSVRMVEQMARRLAQDKIRKRDKTPEMMALEKSLTETLGTRVLIENRPQGGRLLIEFFSPEDLSHIAGMLATQEAQVQAEAEAPMADAEEIVQVEAPVLAEEAPGREISAHLSPFPNTTPLPPQAAPAPVQAPEEDEDLYAVKNFAV
jgi:hypothetical protein